MVKVRREPREVRGRDDNTPISGHGFTDKGFDD